MYISVYDTQTRIYYPRGKGISDISNSLRAINIKTALPSSALGFIRSSSDYHVAKR